jgi:hypothetical protein
LHNFWVEGEDLYTVMELADKTLSQLAEERGGGMPQAELLPLFAETAEALDYLHDQRILHRDIKPANILLLGSHAKVADLGLAKFNPEEVAVSTTGAGTLRYMAPESLNNRFQAQGDQYALALCYAELRLGRPVCEGSNTMEVMQWHLFGKPRLDSLEEHEANAVRRALSKDAAERFPSCQEFIRALQPPQPAPDVVPPPRPPVPPPARMRWLPWVTLLVGVLCVFLFLSRLRTNPNPPIWLPTDLGFTAPADAKDEPVDGKRYYDRIVKPIGGQDVTFWLIPHKEPGDPATFYMMENKVSNGLFKEAVKSQEFLEILADLRKDYPGLVWGEWVKGGIRNGREDVGSADDTLPVLRVNVMEARGFARWIGGDLGNLPTIWQWDAAGGKGRDARAPFADPDQRLLPGDIAIGRRAQGPMPVGTARRDVSLFHCRDMAGNGLEWTRAVQLNLKPITGYPTHVGQENVANYDVDVRGQSYFRDKPFEFTKLPDSKPLKGDDPAVGFRVVLEP